MVDRNILVSVIIPTYQRFESLFRAIDSVAMQTYKNIEIIVVDDNYDNYDLRAQILDRIRLLDYKVEYIALEQHFGSALARNKGIESSHGYFLAFLDDDDVFYPTKIEQQVDFFQKEDNKFLGLVYCFGRIIYPNGRTEMENTDVSGIKIAKHMINNIAGTSFWLCKRSVLIDVGMFDSIGAHDDGIVILKMMAKGYRVDLVRECLVDYFVHKYSMGITGITQKTLEADTRYFEICKEYFYLLSAQEKMKVVSHYYDDRNWNLIILRNNEACRVDFKKMKNDNVGWRVILKCKLRYFFRSFIRLYEMGRLKNRGMNE